MNNKMKKVSVLLLLMPMLLGCKSGEDDFFATGQFETTEITVSAEVTGRVVDLNIEEGNSVTKQEVVGVIDSTQLFLKKMQLLQQGASVRKNSPQVSQQIAALEERISHQKSELKRLQNLYDVNAATQKQVDDATSMLKVTTRELRAKRTQLVNTVSSIDAQSSAVDIQVAQVQDKLTKCVLQAPIDGIILNTYIDKGELAMVGKPLYKVADLKHLYLRAYITSTQLPSIKRGQEVKVLADFGGGVQVAYPAFVTWIAGESEFTPKSIQTEDSRANLVYAIKVAVVNDGKIKLGMYGKVIL